MSTPERPRQRPTCSGSTCVLPLPVKAVFSQWDVCQWGHVLVGTSVSGMTCAQGLQGRGPLLTSPDPDMLAVSHPEFKLRTQVACAGRWGQLSSAPRGPASPGLLV